MNKEAAMSLYEILDLLLQAIVIFIDIITRLLHSVNAGERFPDFAGFRFPLLGKKIY